MDRLPPNRNEYWQHFKGDKYEILGISFYQESFPCFLPSYCAQHTESLISLPVYVFDAYSTFLYEGEDKILYPVQSHLILTLDDGMTIIGTPHVVYKSCEHPAIWARPLSMFMSRFGMFRMCRFEKVEEYF